MRPDMSCVQRPCYHKGYHQQQHQNKKAASSETGSTQKRKLIKQIFKLSDFHLRNCNTDLKSFCQQEGGTEGEELRRYPIMLFSNALINSINHLINRTAENA